MPKPLALHPDRLFPTQPAVRALAREPYQSVAPLPIVCPHGHTDRRWFADNAPFAGATPSRAWLDWVFSAVLGLEVRLEPEGLYNTVGFNDDTRAFLSIPARHDVVRRIDCGMLAKWVTERRLEDWEAAAIAVDLAYTLAKKAYRL